MSVPGGFFAALRSSSGGPFPGASLYLNLLSGTSLDSRVTFTRDSNATLVDGTGRIVYAPANFLLRSEEFNDAAWSTGGTASVTANTTAAPNGALTADTLTASVGTFPHQIVNAVGMGVVILANTTYATSIYVKAGTFSFFQLYMATAPFGVDAFANFNLATGTVGTVGSAATAAIQNVGNGWYRCSVVATATAAATGASARVNFAIITSATAPRAESWTATGTETLFIWGAQLEPVTYQTVPGPYVATTSAAYYGPRFDYNPVTLAPLGLLIEEQRTNLLLYSQQFDDAAWAKSGVTVTANNIISPDGTSNADRVTSTGSSTLTQSAVATATSHTFTVFAKQGSGAGDGARFLLRNETSATNLVGILMDYSTGAFSYIAGTTGATVTPVGNGWWRITLSATSGITVGNVLLTYVGFTGGGSAGQFMFAYGAQLEAGSFATSYIPTVASQVTRLADVATMTGTNFSSWYNASAGTFFTEADVSSVAAGDKYVVTIDGALGRVHYVNTATMASFDGTNIVSTGQATSANTVFKTSVAWSGSTMSVSANGAAAVGGNFDGSWGTTIFILGGTTGSGIAPINGHIRQIAYFNTRLPNAQLEALTAPPLITSLSLDFLNGVYEG